MFVQKLKERVNGTERTPVCGGDRYTGHLGPCGSQRVPAGTVKWTIGRETLITFPSLLHKN